MCNCFEKNSEIKKWDQKPKEKLPGLSQSQRKMYYGKSLLSYEATDTGHN